MPSAPADASRLRRGLIVDGYRIALFIHLAALVAAAWASSRTHLAETRAHRAATAGEALQWYMIAGKAARIFPVVIVLLLATGGYMMSRGGYTWRDGWIVTGVLAALLLFAVGGVLGARGRAGARALAQGDPGAAPPAPDYVAARLSRLNTGIALGAMFVMVTKPSLVVSLAALVAAAIIGAVSVRAAAPEAATRVPSEAAGA